ncbi:MAG: PIN domain-containing protein [Proteobacteria bacterium]|nr:PIN domain-containing protein [Pseudomonadota bacterium]
MIAVDTNILVYAHRRDMPFHHQALAALRSCAEGQRTWALLWPTLHELLAVVTNPRIFRRPSTLEQALAQLREWLRAPTVHVLGESPRHLDTLADVLRSSAVVGAKVHDARIAALCIDHGVRELWSADRDFSRFPELRVVNPLVAA